MTHPAPSAGPSDTDRPSDGGSHGDAGDPTSRGPRRRLAGLAVVAAALLAASWLLTAAEGTTTVAGWEADTFDAANGLPDGLRFPLVPVMQLGTFPMWVVGGAIAYAVTRRWRPALATAGAVVLAWATSRVVKATVERGRPPELLDDVELREHGVDGHGYVSGHATVAFAVATVLTAVLPGRWRWLPYPLAALVALARMFVGVHLPLDVVGGAGLGTLCGLVALAALGLVGRRDRPGTADAGDDRQPAGSPGAG